MRGRPSLLTLRGDGLLASATSPTCPPGPGADEFTRCTTMPEDHGFVVRDMEVDGVVRAIAEDIAMICYTSGSTGDPKGVLLSHTTVLAKVGDVVEGQGLRGDDRIGDLLSLGFSAGINTLLAGIACSATVLCGDPRRTDVVSLSAWLRAEGATTLHASVVLARSLGTSVRTGTIAPIDSVRQVALYGEAATGGDVAQVRRIAQHRRPS